MLSISKLTGFYDLFRKGEAVADPLFLHKGQLAAGSVTALLAAVVVVAKSFGYEIPLTDEQLVNLGASVVTVLGLFHIGATVASTDEIGLPAKSQPVGADIPPVAPRVQEVAPVPKPKVVLTIPKANPVSYPDKDHGGG